jgi:hypothetical protein
MAVDVAACLDALEPLFWDVDIQSIEITAHKKFIIERVLKYGDEKEVCTLLRMYSETDIGKVVKTSRNLDRKTANYWAIHLGIPTQEVKCLNMQLIQNCFY